MNNRCLLVDSNNICYIQRHGMGSLSHDDQPTGIIFGFMQTILWLAKNYDTNQFAFAWDSRKSYRSKIYPKYKSTRKARRENQTEEEREQSRISYEQFVRLQEDILPTLNFVNNFIQTGIEADDIIASCVQNNDGYQFIIVSTDQDLWQLLAPNVSIHNPSTKRLMTFKMFQEAYDIAPRKWRRVKALAGCSTDDVHGIPGVGNKIALRYIHGELPVRTKTYQKIVSAEGRKIYNRNMQLVSLPFERTKEYIIQETKPSISQFIDICQLFNFRSFLYSDTYSRWCKYVFKEGLTV